MGRCREALAQYLAVTDDVDRPEADFQAGVLLKFTGNSAAGRSAYARSAAHGHGAAIQELDRAADWDASPHPRMFERASETGESESRTLARLISLETAPLDWRRLAAAAEGASVRGLPEAANLLADLALVVGGQLAERKLPYRTVLKADGLSSDRYARHLGLMCSARCRPPSRCIGWLRHLIWQRRWQARSRRGRAPTPCA